MNNLLHFRSQKNFESILRVLENALPDNLEVQEELEGLITKKSSFIRKLPKRWVARVVPIYSERSIREMNLEFMADLQQHRGNQTVILEEILSLWWYLMGKVSQSTSFGQYKTFLRIFQYPVGTKLANWLRISQVICYVIQQSLVLQGYLDQNTK